MAEFLEAYGITVEHEGGYSNHPNDKGGETYKGISRLNFPNWQGWIFVDEIKDRCKDAQRHISANLDGNIRLQEMVQQFYRINFWDALNCEGMPQLIANELFDTAVNMGTNYAAKCLQNALNKMNRNQKDYANLKVDGDVGNKTIEALKTYQDTNKRYAKAETWLLKWMNYFQMKRYDEITNRDEIQEVFIKGWTNRV